MEEKIGHYSGNRRQDVSSYEEPDDDTEEVRKRWLESGRERPIKRRLRLWRQAVAHTTDFNLIATCKGLSQHPLINNRPRTLAVQVGMIKAFHRAILLRPRLKPCLS